MNGLDSSVPRIRLTPRRCLLLMWAAGTLACGVVARAAELTFDLSIERGRVPQNMRLIRVKQGDVVRLRWRTDQPLTLHLHGYDIEQKVEAGAVAETRFTARATGRFPIHVHHARERAGSHSHDEPPLVRIEVYPH
jgi:hypothetical protein